MANTYLSSLSLIKSNAQKALEDKIAAENAKNSAGKMQYDYNIGQADKTYQPKYGQAYNADAIQSRMLRERMANMGLGAGGGQSMKASTTQANNFVRGLTGIGLEKQGYIDTQNNAKSQADANSQASIADITAQAKMSENADLMKQRQSIESQLLSMYLGKKMTRAEYNRQMKAIADFFAA